MALGAARVRLEAGAATLEVAPAGRGAPSPELPGAPCSALPGLLPVRQNGARSLKPRG